jgi:hypothetical protein
MTKIALTRKQILQLSELAEKFPDSEWFVIEEKLTSGIGPSVTVSMSAFGDMDTTIDITDWSIW